MVPDIVDYLKLGSGSVVPDIVDYLKLSSGKPTAICFYEGQFVSMKGLGS